MNGFRERKAFFVQDTFVKVVLKDESATPSSDDDTGTSTTAVTSDVKSENSREYFIHKSLLSSLSPELDKHTNNDMKEGREGVLALSEVDEPTLEAFLDWAYFKDYTLSVSSPHGSQAIAGEKYLQGLRKPADTWSTILPHTKIYVLGDRFNITALKDLAFSKIDTMITNRKKISDTADIAALLQAVTYAYDNLLFRTTTLKGKDKLDPTREKIEKLLKYFANFIAFSLEQFRGNAGFRKLIPNCPEFAEAIIISARPAVVPPWVTSKINSASDAKGTSLSVTLTRPTTDTNHILHRSCSSCAYRGLAGIKCKSCNKYDFYVGTQVDYYGSSLGKEGEERLSGTKTNFQYTCLGCKAKNTYSTTSVNFSHPYAGGRGGYQECIGYLACGGCNLEGFFGCLSTNP